MESRSTSAKDVDGAREYIFDLILEYDGKNIICFDGSDGFGAAPVIASIAQVLPSIKAKKTPPHLCYDRIIYIDCSAWISERVMQRKIAEELELDRETIAMFDKQDEEDDFNGVDHGSRGLIRRVSQEIAKTLWSSSFFMVFLNGSDHEVDVQKFGISPYSLNHVVLWTFNRRFLTMRDKRTQDELVDKLRYTNLYVRYTWSIYTLNTSELIPLLREEVAILVARNPCMQDIDLKVVTDWCLYCLFLHYCCHGTDRVYWSAQAPNFCLYDGIIQSYKIREIRDALHREINWDCDVSMLSEVCRHFPEALFLIARDDTVYQIRPYRWIWISTTNGNLKLWADMQTIPATTSSLFVEFDNSLSHQRLPNEQCNNLQVLILSWCTFSFVFPPFLKCHKLRFLGLDHCHDNKIIKEDELSTEWTFLHNLLVLDIHHTHWDEIVSLDKIDLMANLQELNIEGFCCWQYMNKLRGRLTNLQRLKIIKPTQDAETSRNSNTQEAETSANSNNNSFMDKTKLEILNLSGNMDMKNLPAGLSNASSLQMLILDGCDGLEDVESNELPSTLRSFSFDGYGPASHWTSLIDLPPKSSRMKSASNAEKKDTVKISKISLQGCTQLEILFLRGLSNLDELDLSGSAIKILNFETMVANVPRLRRLFLLGCQHLRSIQWGSFNSKGLDLVCVDTRPGKAHGFTRPPLLQHKSFSLQLHAVLAEARLSRSLWPLCSNHERGMFYLNIHITSSRKNCGVVQHEATDDEVVELINPHHHAPTHWYGDELTKIIGDAPLLAFPEPPQQLDRHIRIGDGSLNLESELKYLSKGHNLNDIMRRRAESLHLHDSMIKSSLPTGSWYDLRWCRVERCPNLDTVFPPGAKNYELETIWASDLPMARSIWSKGPGGRYSFQTLQHLHLRSCPRLQFMVPVWISSFYNLKTIHIIHCSDLSHVLVLDETSIEKIDAQGVSFPKLTTIHLYDLPKLQQICEVKMLAPALETIRIRGCFGLLRLPALEGRKVGVKKPAVEMEKDVWDALEWDGLAAGHHPDLYEAPVHSRHYRRRRLLRGTVLR